MADADRALEGWHVAQRPAFLAAVLIPLALGTIVVGAARLYDRDLRPGHSRRVTTFTAPGVETFIHDGQGDPRRPPVGHRTDPAVAAAKRAVVTGGLLGWGSAR